MIGLGTLVNAGAVAAGSALALLVQALARLLGKGRKRHLSAAWLDNLSDLVMKGVGLCVLYIGISGALKDGNSRLFYDNNTMILILSMVFGALIGHLIDLDKRINQLGDFLERKVQKGGTGDNRKSLSAGFVSASLLFCVGAMTIVGSVQEGLTGSHDTLFAKALLDGISAVIYTSALGIGVMFSAVFVLVYQGLLTLLAVAAAPLLGPTVQMEMTVVGSVIILGLALNMLGITRLKVMNFVPAIFLPILLCLFL